MKQEGYYLETNIYCDVFSSGTASVIDISRLSIYATNTIELSGYLYNNIKTCNLNPNAKTPFKPEGDFADLPKYQFSINRSLKRWANYTGRPQN